MALRICFCVPVLLCVLYAQGEEPVLSKDTLSVHKVQRGDMPVRERATGIIASLSPPRAILTLLDQTSSCRIGQRASAQVNTPTVLSGKIVRIDTGCEVEFSEPLPNGTTVGDKLGALVETGVARDVIFFDRPANSAANSDAVVFVIEPGDQYARRVAVHYGRLSGSMIEVTSGLSAGDRVIVTDTSKWKASPRVRLE